MSKGLYSDKTHEWAATAAKLIVVGKASEVVRDLLTMSKKQALTHQACLYAHHTTFLDNHGVFSKLQHALNAR